MRKSMSRPYSNILEKYRSDKVPMAEEIYQQGGVDERVKLLAWLSEKGYLNRVDIDYDYEESAYEVVNVLSVEEVLEEYKEQNNGDD